jgi:hypothetical protein
METIKEKLKTIDDSKLNKLEDEATSIVVELSKFLRDCIEKKPTQDRTLAVGVQVENLFGLEKNHEGKGLFQAIRGEFAALCLETFALHAEQYRDEWMEEVRKVECGPQVREHIEGLFTAFAESFTNLAKGARSHAADLRAGNNSIT